MLVSYKNKRDEVFYLSEKDLTSSYGDRIAKKIGQRIAELVAADNPQQLPKNARFHEHSGKRKGLFSLDLIHPLRLIVSPTCKYTNWVEIVSVEIYEIIDPH
jgi:plasmid maintenance system killer protein